MKEVLHYIDAPASGVSGYHKMKDGWNKTVGMITDRRPLKIESDEVVQAIESWHEEEACSGLVRLHGFMATQTSESEE